MAVTKQLTTWIQTHPKEQPYLVYAAVALLVLGPLLGAGYILTLDMVFTPRLPLPDTVSASYLFRAALHVLNLFVPSEIIQKLVLFCILFFSGVGMHRLMQYLRPTKAEQTEYETWGTYIAGGLYMINPFTYSRFMAGQYSVLLGYALLPFFVRALLSFLVRPKRRSVLALSGWTVAISIVSIHTIGLVLIVAVLGTALYCWRYRRQHQQVKAITLGALATLGIVLVASSYWLVPLIQGESTTAEAVTRFGITDQQAFVTVGGSGLGRLANIIRLQGFWPEGQGLYTLPQERLPGWGLVAIGVWILVGMGGMAMWRRWKRSEVALFALSALIAAILAMGSIHGFLTDTVPFFAGYREPHKFVGLVALAYALFAGQGAISLLHRYKQRSRELSANLATSLLLILPVAFTPTMLWGFTGQLRTSHYPQDWFALNDFLTQDTSDFKTIFLPWHLYSHYGFAGRLIANPAPDFFEKPMLVSDDPEFAGIKPAILNPQKQRVDRELEHADRSDNLGERLAPVRAKYIVLAKEFDADTYGYLDYQKDLRLISETATLKLYRNEAFVE